MRVAILTGGGDCPGLNAAIRGVTLRLIDYGYETIGVRRGWLGLLEKMTFPLQAKDVEDIIHQGGTILGSSRTNPFKKDENGKDSSELLLNNLKEMGIDAIAAIGGEDTLGVASKLWDLGFPTVGIPKTMDNDLSGTDFTFGFDSSVAVAVDALDRLRDTAKSHSRAMVLEVMGRHAGWVALYVGLGGGADWIMIPEVTPDMDALCQHLLDLRKRGQDYALIVTSEGAEIPLESGEEAAPKELDAFGHVILKERGIGERIAQIIEKRTGIETRNVVIGHIQRGGSPTVFDRVLGSRVGLKAAEMIHSKEFGMMAALRGVDIVSVPLSVATGTLKTVPLELYEEVAMLFNR